MIRQQILRPSNLLARLLLLVIAVTLPAAAVLIQFQHELQLDRRAQANNAALRQAELLSTSLGIIAEGARQLMASIAHYNRVARLEPGCETVLRGVQGEVQSYSFLAVTDGLGRVICGSPPQMPPASALQAFAVATAAAGGFNTGRYTPGSPGQPAYLPFGMPFALAGEGGTGVIIAGLNLDWLTQFLAALKHPPRMIMSVVDSGGTVLAREPNSPRYVGRQVLPEVRALLDRPVSGNARVPSFEGPDRIVGYVPVAVDPLHLYVSAGFNADDLTEDIDAGARRGYVLIALGAAVSLLLALIAGQRFVQAPAAVLLRAARRWGSGDLAVRATLPPGSAQEFTSLGDAFNAMAATLQQQRSELQSLNGVLEIRVAERTKALLESNNRLQVETAEREVTEAQLRQAQKLQAVGQLAEGIAHDFNNLLAAVLGSLELVRRALPGEESAVRRLLNPAEAAVERGIRLTAKLIGFSRKQPLFSMPIDVAATIDGMAGLITSTLGPSVRVETDLPSGLWTVSVDPNQFESSILNLALNARDAMPTGGRLTIAAANLSIECGQGSKTVAPGDYVNVRVSDNGQGMSEETLSRVFEPFFTTQTPGLAAGLGLSQVHGMARQSGGDVTISSRPGEGTEVSVLLPRAAGVLGPYLPASTAGPLPPAKFRDGAILLVDDDDEVREVTAALLVDCGYGVVEAASGAAAIHMLADSTNRIRFVVADYAMPGMTGRELLDHVRRTRPDMPFLLITGFADWTALTGDVLPTDQIVRKPFRGVELIDRIQMVWERRLTAVR